VYLSDDKAQKMGAAKKSLEVTGMACGGGICVQDGRSVAVVAGPTVFLSVSEIKIGGNGIRRRLIVPFEDERQQNDIRGKWPYFVGSDRED
jgi:hypothetical protein